MSDIEELTLSIWEAMFEPSLTLTPGGEAGAGELVTNLVVIDGAWQGAVMTQFPVPLAVKLTAAMLQTQEVPRQDDILDALGELCNIMAGNLKALVRGPSRLSPPTGTFDGEHTLGIPDAVPIATAPFTCDGHVFTVTVLERRAPVEEKS